MVKSVGCNPVNIMEKLLDAIPRMIRVLETTDSRNPDTWLLSYREYLSFIDH
jgi:hypothetical protein